MREWFEDLSSEEEEVVTKKSVRRRPAGNGMLTIDVIVNVNCWSQSGAAACNSLMATGCAVLTSDQTGIGTWCCRHFVFGQREIDEEAKIEAWCCRHFMFGRRDTDNEASIGKTCCEELA